MAKLTYEQLIPSLKKWAGKLCDKDFSFWDLISAAWISGKLQKINNLRYTSNVVKWAMLDYKRAVRKDKTRKRLAKQGRHYPREYSFTEREVENGDNLGDNIKVENNTYQKVDSDDIFEQLTRGFTKREKMVIRLRYKEGFTFKEIGRIVGTSESFISLLHKELIKRLKEIIEAKQQAE